ncbi:MAG: response regulator transcription factor [Hyphomicrobium sp.]|jgi:DNA-binding NarL/FixJ family response regulator
MPSSYRVAVVDDHPLFRAGVVHTLKMSGQFDVVAEGGSASDAIRIARELAPDAMLLDLNMPGSGVEAALQLSKSHPSVRLVIITVCEIDESVSTCLEAGVRGYVLKGTSGEELLRVVRSVCEGEAYITPQLAARLLTKMRSKQKERADNPIGELTAREEAVLTHVSRGQSNKEIARSLSLSEKTVKHYMTSLMQKLQVRSRLEAALFFRDKGE